MLGFHIDEQLIFKITFLLKVNMFTCEADKFNLYDQFSKENSFGIILGVCLSVFQIGLWWPSQI